LFFADGKILVSEFIGDVPADGTEFTTILDDSMEEAESEQ